VKEKAGHAMDATNKDKAQQTKDHAAGTGHDTTEGTKQKAADALEAAKQKASEASQYAKDSAVPGKDKTGGVVQQVRYHHPRRRSHSQKNSTRSLAWQHTPQQRFRHLWPLHNFSWSFFTQATEQVKSAAAGARDAVMNTLGMSGDQKPAGDTGKDSSTITRDQ
jgi:hypothetical protein